LKTDRAIFLTALYVISILVLTDIGHMNSAVVAQSNPVAPGVYWSDDFSDGDYDGWTIMEGTFITPDSPRYPMQAGTSHSMNMISHPSNQTIGTWFFEIYEDSHFSDSVEILFMVNGTNVENFKGYSMRISYTSDYQRLWFNRWDYSAVVGHTAGWILAYQDIWTSDQPHHHGWNSYNVTRTDDGMVYILRNDLPILTCDPAVVEWEFDVLLTHSDKFIARLSSGHAIDTIVVGTEFPTITTPTTSTTTTTTDTTTTIESSTTTTETTTAGDTTFAGPSVQLIQVLTLGCIGAIAVIVVVLILRKR
jgi:hypothetical protein